MKPRKAMKPTRSQRKMTLEASISQKGEDGVCVGGGDDKMGSILTWPFLYSLQYNHLPQESVQV